MTLRVRRHVLILEERVVKTAECLALSDPSEVFASLGNVGIKHRWKVVRRNCSSTIKIDWLIELKVD